MTDISKHPLLKKCYEVSQAIEKCGASAELTDAVGLSGELMDDIEAFLKEKTPTMSEKKAKELMELAFKNADSLIEQGLIHRMELTTFIMAWSMSQLAYDAKLHDEMKGDKNAKT